MVNPPILVTGHSGFVGSHVGRILPSVPFSDQGNEIDIRNLEHVKDFIARVRPSNVIHLAALSHVQDSFQAPQMALEVNLLGTLNLLRALESIHFQGRFLYVSSADAYGALPDAELPATEVRPLAPRNPYAVSKAAAEMLCYQWSQTSGFEVLIARPFNHIGPGQREDFVVSGFARQIAQISLGKSEPRIVVGDVQVTRDFTDVRDVVRAYGLLLELGKNGEVYNVCSGRESSIQHVLDLLLRLAGIEARIESAADRIRPHEQRRMVGSNTKLKNATGWSLRYSLEQSLSDILKDWSQRLSRG